MLNVENMKTLLTGIVSQHFTGEETLYWRMIEMLQKVPMNLYLYWVLITHTTKLMSVDKIDVYHIYEYVPRWSECASFQHFDFCAYISRRGM